MRESTFQAVSTIDPAIDTERMTLGEMLDYIKTRDFKMIEPFIRPGQDPTIYTVGEVPHEYWDSYVMAGSEAERPLRAFRCGLLSVRNLYSRDGVKSNWAPITNGKAHVMSDQDCARFSPAERQEIGEVIFSHSFLHPRIGADFLLPPMLADILGRQEFRLADASPTDAASNSGEPSSASTPHPEKTDKDSGTPGADDGSLTGATAAGTPSAGG